MQQYYFPLDAEENKIRACMYIYSFLFENLILIWLHTIKNKNENEFNFILPPNIRRIIVTLMINEYNLVLDSIIVNIDTILFMCMENLGKGNMVITSKASLIYGGYELLLRSLIK